MRENILHAIGWGTAALTYFIGGWDTPLEILVVVMAADFVTGVLSAIMQCSTKSVQGGLSSEACYRGLLRKVYIIILVGVTAQIASYANVLYLRSVIIQAYIVEEGISIVENAVNIGVPVPVVVSKLLDMLNGGKE